MDVTTDTVPRRNVPKRYATLDAYVADLTDEQREAYRREIRERLGFDPAWEPDRGIGLADLTRLAGVPVGTGTQWRRRTKLGALKKPLLDPKPSSPKGKPLYDPMLAAAWLEWTLRWPPGSAARQEKTAA
jgi:hypothetical protein